MNGPSLLSNRDVWSRVVDAPPSLDVGLRRGRPDGLSSEKTGSRIMRMSGSKDLEDVQYLHV